MSGRRPASKYHALNWHLLYWPTNPARLPKEAAHLAGEPIERYNRKQGPHGCVSVQPDGRGMWFDYTVFDCDKEPA